MISFNLCIYAAAVDVTSTILSLGDKCWEVSLLLTRSGRLMWPAVSGDELNPWKV